ncbi:28671_t:CDS:2, partial [Dentiscutata erythropus]
KNKIITVPVEFRKLQHTSIQNEHPPKVTQPAAENNNDSDESASDEESESEYKEEELEERLFSFLEEEKQRPATPRNEDSNDESVVSQYNEQPKGVESHKAYGTCAVMIITDEKRMKTSLIPIMVPLEMKTSSLTRKMMKEFYLNEQEEPSYELDIGKLDDDNHDKIEKLLMGYKLMNNIMGRINMLLGDLPVAQREAREKTTKAQQENWKKDRKVPFLFTTFLEKPEGDSEPDRPSQELRNSER